MADFTAQFTGQFTEQKHGELATIEESTIVTADPTMAMVMLANVLSRFVPQADPLAPMRSLQEACDQGWLLSTSQLAPLLGLSRLEGQEIKRYGFVCTRVGRNGLESAWRITKATE